MDLPTLKRLSRQDPLSYKNEILSHLDYFYAKLETAKLRTKVHDKELASLVSLLASVSHKFDYSNKLCSAIIKHLKEDLHQKTRQVLLTATFTLRLKKSVSLSLVLPIWLKLVEIKDKNQKERLVKFLINDITISQKKGENLTEVKKFFLEKLNDSIKSTNEEIINIGRFVLSLLIKLFNRKIWLDKTTANVASECVLAHDKKLAAAGARLVLDMPFKSVDDEDVTVVPSGVINYLRDPYGYATAIFKRCTGDKITFSTRLMLLNVCTRVIGWYKLIIPNVYLQLSKYLNPKQKMVTHILAYLIQSTHELVPPDMLYPVLDILANQFIANDRPSPVILTGLHTAKEMVKRCPHCLNESIREYIKDFVKYKHKEISAAARSLVGKNAKPALEYGQVEVHRGVEGEELLNNKKRVSLIKILNQSDFNKLSRGRGSHPPPVRAIGPDSIRVPSAEDGSEQSEPTEVHTEGQPTSKDEEEGGGNLGSHYGEEWSDEEFEESGDEEGSISDECDISEDEEEDDSDEGGEGSPSRVDPRILKFGSKVKLNKYEKRVQTAKIIAEKKAARKKAVSKHGKKQSLTKKVQARNKPIMMKIKSKKAKKKQLMDSKDKAQILKRHIKSLSKGRIHKKKKRM